MRDEPFALLPAPPELPLLVLLGVVLLVVVLLGELPQPAIASEAAARLTAR